MSTPEIISAIKDIVTIITLIIGGAVTIYGVSTWRKQQTAKVDYELAKRILMAVYNKRKILETILFIFDIVYKDKKQKKQDIDKYCDRLDEINVELNVDLLEAEAMWGDQVKYNTQIKEFKYIESHITTYYGGRGFTPLHHKGDDLSPDEDLEKVYKAVKDIEDMLRPKLRYKQ